MRKMFIELKIFQLYLGDPVLKQFEFTYKLIYVQTLSCNVRTNNNTY